MLADRYFAAVFGLGFAGLIFGIGCLIFDEALEHLKDRYRKEAAILAGIACLFLLFALAILLVIRDLFL